MEFNDPDASQFGSEGDVYECGDEFSQQMDDDGCGEGSGFDIADPGCNGFTFESVAGKPKFMACKRFSGHTQGFVFAWATPAQATTRFLVILIPVL